MDVLVTGADQRQGLAVIRALGRKGLEIFATGQERNSVGFFSRYTKELCQYPSPFADKNGFVDTILQVVKKHRIPVVFPTVESTVIALDEFREEFEGLTRLAIAPREPLHIALDKKQTLTLAKELGVPIPRTCFANSLEEALAFAEGIGYPVVMKIASPDIIHKSDAGGVKVGVKNDDELRAAVDRMTRVALDTATA